MSTAYSSGTAPNTSACVKVGDRSCPWTWTFECWTVIGPRVLTRDLPCRVYLRSSQSEKMVFDLSRVHHGSPVQYAFVDAFLNGLARFFL